MVKWEPTLNAHILAAALSVAEVTATNEMAEAALTAWSKYIHLRLILSHLHCILFPFYFIPIHSIQFTFTSSLWHTYPPPIPLCIFIVIPFPHPNENKTPLITFSQQPVPNLGEKPTVRAITDQIRKLVAAARVSSTGKKTVTRAAAAAQKGKDKKRGLDEEAAQEDDAVEPGGVDDVAGPGGVGEGEEPEPAAKKQKRVKAVGGKKMGGKKV